MMIRLIAIFVPTFALISAIAIDTLLSALVRARRRIDFVIGVSLVLGIAVLHVNHVTYFAFTFSSENYINHPIRSGNDILWSDDHRDGYRWLFENSAPDAKVVSFWDLGYQLSSMAGRTVFVDGNTNNFTHLSTIGLIALSPEKTAWEIARAMDADYIVVVFGGVAGFAGDDLNKAPWLVSGIRESFPNMTAEMFDTQGSPFFANKDNLPGVRDSSLFKLSYYRMKGSIDRARGLKVGNLGFAIEQFTEVYTTKHWLLRIYRVNPDPIWP
jgi:dolichyl-diphosphooligosaccharide--protein glycosyltransferase